MALGRRIGLSALLEVAKVDPREVTATDLGFRIGPRINARGRVSHAAEAVELLLCRDPGRARTLAGALDAANRHRRELERATVEAAVERVQQERMQEAPGLVLIDPAWHPGVVGLVATRLVHRFHRPAIVIGEGGKGSGRTFEGLNLFAATEGAGEHLVRFGGHPAAVGVTIEPERVDLFREAFCCEVRRQLGDPPFVPSLRPDLEVEARLLDLDILHQLSRLEPFGQANPEPLLVSRNVPVRGKRVVGKSHLKLQLGDDRHAAIGFGLGDLAGHLPERVDVAFRLGRNAYGGNNSLELRIEDLRANMAPS
jgi:single-stranded-DNA-specific exonuclease